MCVYSVIAYTCSLTKALGNMKQLIDIGIAGEEWFASKELCSQTADRPHIDRSVAPTSAPHDCYR